MENKEPKAILSDVPAPSSRIPKIITDEQAEQAVAYWTKREIDRAVWKMKNLGYSAAQIEDKLKTTDFSPSEAQRATIIDKANLRYHREIEIKEEAKNRQENEERERIQIMQFWNAGRFYHLLRERYRAEAGQFIEDEGTKTLHRAACFYLAGDPRFTSELGHDPRKGLLVIGTAGLGKTSTFRHLSDNPRRPVKIYSMIEIAEAVRETGECNIYTAGDRVVLIDDVGTEPETVNHYGTKINWFKDFIESYYHTNRSFHNLVVTTNLGGAEIEARYGYRVRSRMREMFNTVQVTGTDKRK
jgi:hypothetical protein